MWQAIEVGDSMPAPEEMKIGPTLSLGVGDSVRPAQQTCKMARWGAVFVQWLKHSSGGCSKVRLSGILVTGGVFQETREPTYN